MNKSKEDKRWVLTIYEKERLKDPTRAE